MAKSHLELFPSEYHMLKFFGEYLPSLDVNQSAALAPFLYVYNRKYVLSRNLQEFLTHMESLTALGINVHASTQKGRAFLIFFNDQLKSPKDFKVNTDASALKKSVIKDLDANVDTSSIISTKVSVEESVQEVKEEVKESVKEINPEKDAILAKAESLRDDSKKSAAKNALEAYALELGISLSKGKTFDGMIEDLKAAL